jgi:4-hydroxybenzoate polyprenyltransferase
MNKALRVASWIVGVLVVLFLIGLGIRIAKALLFIGVIAGVAMLLYALFGKRAPRGKSP